MFIVTVAISLFTIKVKPSDVGQLPYGIDDTENIEIKSDKQVELTGYTLEEAKTSSVFWVYVVAIVLLGLVFAGVQMHIPSYMQSVGHSLKFSSMITSLVSIMGIVSNIFLGILLEKAGIKKGMLIIGFFMTLSVGFLLLGKVVIFALLFVLIFGAFRTIASMGPSYLTSEIFGKKDYGTILGIVIMFFQFGGAIGPTLSGFIYDSTGEYTVTWVIFIILLIITFGTFLLSINLASKKKNFK